MAGQSDQSIACLVELAAAGKADAISVLLKVKEIAKRRVAIWYPSPGPVHGGYQLMNVAWIALTLALLGSETPGSGPAGLSEPGTVCDAAETWSLSLSEAIGAALAHCESVRVPSSCSSPTSPSHSMRNPSSPMIVIGPRDADTSFWRFKAETLELVQSVEQKYWNLVERQKSLAGQQLAVHEASTFLAREQALGQADCPGKSAGRASAQQTLDWLALDLAQRASDALTAERELRQVMGLPAADHHRICPVTVPRQEMVDFDWQSCLRQMSMHQPDIIQQELMVRLAELQLIVSRNQLIPLLSLDVVDPWELLGKNGGRPLGPITPTPEMFGIRDSMFAYRKALLLHPGALFFSDSTRWQVGFCPSLTMACGRSGLANTRYATYLLLRQRDCLAQIVHQTMHSLARSFLEVDTNYRQYKTAVTLSTAAAERMVRQRTLYAEGRTTVERLMDAVRESAQMTDQEALCEKLYSTALTGLEKAKGTLLEDRGIVVSEQPNAIAEETAALVEDFPLRILEPKMETGETRMQNLVGNHVVTPALTAKRMPLENIETWLFIWAKQRDVERLLELPLRPSALNW